MCYIIHMDYEFNNWRAFYDMVKFVSFRHPANFPEIDIRVPVSCEYTGWDGLEDAINDVSEYRPEDLEEMSIYGIIKFHVTKDECNGII